MTQDASGDSGARDGDAAAEATDTRESVDRPGWVPWVAERDDEPTSPFSAFDDFGRKVPRRFGIADYLLTIARSEPARVRRVPAASIVEETEAAAFVECPCGARPVVTDRLAKCQGCDRNYVRIDGGMVFVAYAGEVPPLHIVN